MKKVESHIFPKKAAGIKILEYKPSILDSNEELNQLKNLINTNYGVILKKIISDDLIREILEYLKNVGRNSLPSYHKLLDGCPDFHRVVQFDKRSTVKSKMHQFLFHPWNQNIFDFFAITKHVWFLKNLLSGFPKEHFLKNIPSDGYICRVVFQYYPIGAGAINRHSDPVGGHQRVIPIIQLTKKGIDYDDGGFYVEGKNGDIDVDSLLEPGDVFLADPQIIHGVKPIKSNDSHPWLSYKGRWMILVTTIKTDYNKDAALPIEIN